MENTDWGKLIIGGADTAPACLREKKRRGRERCARATSLSQISVRFVCLYVRVFIIGPTVPMGGGGATSARII